MGQCCAPQTTIPYQNMQTKPRAEEEHDFKGVPTKIEGYYRGQIIRQQEIQLTWDL
ncbi:hypothetical protein pb186bvf_004058 [Paramecium bursaria]